MTTQHARSSYGDSARRRRATRRERVARQVRVPVVLSEVADPIFVAATPRRRAAWLAFPGWLLASAVLHVAIVCAAYLRATRPTAPVLDTWRQAVQVNIQDAEVQPPVASPPRPRTVAVLRAPTPRIAEPSADPIDLTPPPPQPEQPPPPARRIVGINMDSTSNTGAGGAFAVGNTRMGQTAVVAEDPDRAERLAAAVTPPRRRVEQRPEYPPTLRARKIEGDVRLRVGVDASGKVVNVAVVLASGFDEFDRAAVASAWGSSYDAARAGGIAVDQSIEFTVRFRLRP
jgi:TonB family protein